MPVLSSKELKDLKKGYNKPLVPEVPTKQDEPKKIVKQKYILKSAPSKGQSRCFFYHDKKEVSLELTDGCYIPEPNEIELMKSAGMIKIEDVEVIDDEPKEWVFSHPDQSEDNPINGKYIVHLIGKTVEVLIEDNVLKTNNRLVADYLKREKFNLVKTIY